MISITLTVTTIAISITNITNSNINFSCVQLRIRILSIIISTYYARCAGYFKFHLLKQYNHILIIEDWLGIDYRQMKKKGSQSTIPQMKNLLRK